MILAQICLFAVLPLLAGAWAFCLLREHGLLSIKRAGLRLKKLPGGKVMLLVMAAAAIVYGGSKGGGGSATDPDEQEEPPPQVEPVEDHDVDDGEQLLITSLPCVIKGNGVTRPVLFRLGMESVEAPVTIHTYTGTGTVYSAVLTWGDDGCELSNDAVTVPLIPEILYRVDVSAEHVVPDSQYVIRIGKFDPPLVVTFDGNGGKPSQSWRSYEPGKPYGEFPSADRENHRLTGWATESTNGIVLSIDTAACVGYTNLYAQWEYAAPTNVPPAIITNFVEFVANGGEGNMATQMFVYGEAQALASNLFGRATYDFAGWSLSVTGKVVYADGAIVSNLSDEANAVVPLYAQWTRMTNVYDVAFEPNGGQGKMDKQAFFLGEPQELATNQFSQVGYDFIGWAMSPSGEVVFADCQMVTNVTTNAGEVVSIYAKWKITPLPILSTNLNGVTWYYTATNGTATILNRQGEVHVTAVEPENVTSLHVPNVLYSGTNACAVTAIAENAFKGLTSLTNIIISASVLQIGSGAFSGCGKIARATLPLADALSSLMPDSYRTIQCVSVPEVDDFLEDSAVILADAAFSNCTALAEVNLPLGVTELPDDLFNGCVSLTNTFEMPYTVTAIGARAFMGCSSLTAITVTENVAEIRENAFTDCSRLKIVRYLGDQPEAAEGGAGNIYYHSNTGLVSGYLAGVRNWEAAPEAEETTDDSGDGTNSTTTITYSAVKWPSGGAGRPLVTWKTKMYTLRKVTLNYNNNGKTAAEERIYVTGRVLGELPEPESAEGFLGWFTARYGGVEADPYMVVNSSMTFYAHWDSETSGSGSRGSVEALSEFYSDDDAGFQYTAATFDGLLIEDGIVAGTIQVKTKRGKYANAELGTNSDFTAAMVVRGAKKVTMKGTVLGDGTASAENEKKGLSLEMSFTQFGMTGTYSTEEASYEIISARDRYSAGSDAAKAIVRAALANAKATWNIVLQTDSPEGDGAAFANGYSVLSATVKDKGKSKIKGVMADGTKVSLSSTLIVGDGCCCLPVVAPLYSGKSGGFSFALWFTWSEDASESTVSVVGLSEWDAQRRKGGGFTATFGDRVVSKAGGISLPANMSFLMDGFFDEGDDSFSPDGTEISSSGKSMNIPKADTVKFSKEDGSWQTVDGKDHGNPSGLKLSYSSGTGLFNGSFNVYSVTESGKSKKLKATVNGAIVDVDGVPVGQGTATVKKVGSVPVKIE